MNIKSPFKISGAGYYLPGAPILSSEIEKQLQLSSGWVMDHVGVEKRHIAQHESNTFMAGKALENALEDAGLALKDIGYLIAAAATFDHVIPNRSSMIKAAFQEGKELDFPCMDINSVCTSFLSALDVAAQLLRKGDMNHIAIVSSEKGSLGLSSNDPETYSLFGDGAAAIILSVDDTCTGGLIKYQFKTYSDGVFDTMIKGGGNAHHPKHNGYDEKAFSFEMKGIKLLRLAQQKLPGFMQSVFCDTGLTLQSVDWIVPHQASKLGLKMLVHLNEGRRENIIDQLAQYGNCIAASIPLALVTSIKDGKIQEGDNCFLIGTAAGMSIGGALLKYKSL